MTPSEASFLPTRQLAAVVGLRQGHGNPGELFSGAGIAVDGCSVSPELVSRKVSAVRFHGAALVGRSVVGLRGGFGMRDGTWSLLIPVNGAGGGKMVVDRDEPPRSRLW